MTSKINNYLEFVSSYFYVNKEKIVKDITQNYTKDSGQVIPYLKAEIGPLTRQLSSLTDVMKGGVHNTIVKILAVSKKIIENDNKLITIYTLLVADQYTICKLVLFEKDTLNTSNLKESKVIRLYEVYYDIKELYDNCIRLKREGNVFVVPFSVPGISNALEIVSIKVDTIGEYVSNPKNVSYIQELGIINIQGILYKEKNNLEKYFIVGDTFKIVIWIKKELQEFIDNHCLRRSVNLTFVRIKYGRDSLELLQTEFSKVLISNYVQFVVNIKELVRYEYPAQIMSLREMIDSGMVALPSVAITHIEERATEEGKEFVVVYLYDSTAIVRLYLFDEKMSELFQSIPKLRKIRIISGLYAKERSKDPKYANALSSVNLRIKDEIIQVTEEKLDPSITLLKNIFDLSQPVVTEGILKEKEDSKVFHYKDGFIGYKLTFTIEQQGEMVKVTTFNKRDTELVNNIMLNEDIQVWWVKFRKNRYIVENYGNVNLN